MPAPSRSQAERTEATRAALVAAARPLFAARGFAGVSAEEIVAAAGVSRGALHHHYGDKKGLFRAVFEQLEADFMTDVVVAVDGVAAEDLVPVAVKAFLDICARPEVRQIGLTDAPAVLGWADWRSIEAEYGLSMVVALAADSEPVRSGTTSADVLGQLVLSALIEAALLVANASDPVRRRAEVEATLLRLIGDLFGG
ncbi:MAG TPA: helix-turn-helix domain-containing protein [Galbitalea sp.]|jgi:AcrR family transcriptional regulator